MDRLTYSQAIARLLDEFAWNHWFLSSYWPENEPRVRFMAEIAGPELQAGKPRVLELGCFNGYTAYLFRLLGFEVFAVDAYDDEKRDELFRQGGISYANANLNDASPLGRFLAESFDVVLLAEVFEHILNNPAGLLKEIFRLLRPGGLLILTTPNPSTLANSIRLLRDEYVLWGTPAFLREIKMENGRIIDRGDIHYREYPAWMVRDLIVEVGFRLQALTYYRTGIAPGHSFVKRWLKRLLLGSGLSSIRLFAFGYVIAARKPAA